jgi:hypothetical protein
MNAARSVGAIRIVLRIRIVRERPIRAQAVHSRRAEAKLLGGIADRQKSVLPSLEDGQTGGRRLGFG